MRITLKLLSLSALTAVALASGAAMAAGSPGVEHTTQAFL